MIISQDLPLQSPSLVPIYAALIAVNTDKAKCFDIEQKHILKYVFSVKNHKIDTKNRIMYSLNTNFNLFRKNIKHKKVNKSQHF